MWKTSSMIAAALTLACSEGSTGPDQAACVRGALAQGAIVTGELSSADCTMTRAGVSLPYEVYTVRLSPGERYLITLHSNAAWTPILELRDTTPNHSVVAAGWSDVFVENRYSQLMFVAPNEFPGTTKTYELWVQGDTSAAGSVHVELAALRRQQRGDLGHPDGRRPRCVERVGLRAPRSSHAAGQYLRSPLRALSRPRRTEDDHGDRDIRGAGPFAPAVRARVCEGRGDAPRVGIGRHLDDIVDHRGSR